jgi:ribosomal protein S18 acetylase RimI-like enzyme
MSSRIALAESDQEILACHPIMAELRSHLQREQFVSTVKRLADIAGYRMAYLTDGDVKATAGFRISEWLAGGRYLEIEDLVVASNERSKGYGGELFDWLVKHAEENSCDEIRLVSRVTRFDAHRFYLNKRMIIEAYYFSRQLK